MYDMIKKQTILVFIAMVSWVIYGLWTTSNSVAGFAIGWVFSVDMICAWLMLSTSKRYWRCCKDYGLCKCCYCNCGSITCCFASKQL